MDDFLVNRIMEDFTKGTMTAQEAWSNLQEGRESISDEKYDEVVSSLEVQNLMNDMDNREALMEAYHNRKISQSEYVREMEKLKKKIEREGKKTKKKVEKSVK